MKLTLSLIKADTGSIGGHTRPSPAMIDVAISRINQAKKNKLLIDGHVSFTGDDLALLMSHTRGLDNPEVHRFAWDTFVETTYIAQREGLYAAGQDLLVNAPSSNVRGAGPGVAELEFEHRAKKYRPAESFMMFAADKCGPGAFNLPLFLAFADPMYCAGLMLPNLIKGFAFTLIDMNNAEGDSTALFNAPEEYYSITALLRDNERFGINTIASRTYQETAVSVSAQRLHTIAGKYVGKDDPVALVRTQGIFPAPEEILLPYTLAHYVGGDGRGSHVMPLMPVAINTPVTGFYALPIIAALGFSIDDKGYFAHQYVDFFNNPVWDLVRHNAQKKALELRKQGWSGAAMLPYSELEYSGFRETITTLEKRFAFHKKVRKK